jgi:hypothetical protein
LSCLGVIEQRLGEFNQRIFLSFVLAPLLKGKRNGDANENDDDLGQIAEYNFEVSAGNFQ